MTLKALPQSIDEEYVTDSWYRILEKVMIKMGTNTTDIHCNNGQRDLYRYCEKILYRVNGKQ